MVATSTMALILSKLGSLSYKVEQSFSPFIAGIRLRGAALRNGPPLRGKVLLQNLGIPFV
jgi:hypothetical protein